MNSRPIHQEPWYQRWYIPGVITFVAWIVILLVEVIANYNGGASLGVAPISLLISLSVFVLSWAIEKNWTRTLDQTRGDISSIKEEIRADLTAFAAHIPEPYLAYLRDRLVSRMYGPLHQLVERGRSIGTVEGCTEKLIFQINRMDKHTNQEIRAVCGQKAWDSPEVARYYQANYDKSQEGVKVRRIFLQEPGKRFSEGEKRVLREHLSGRYPNVEGRVLFAKDFISWCEKYHMPSGFGFAILGDVVIVHWGLMEGRREAGRVLEDLWFADVHREILGWTPLSRHENGFR